MRNRKKARRKNLMRLFMTVACLLVVLCAQAVSEACRIPFGGGLLFVGAVLLLMLCVIGGCGKREVSENEE